MAGRASGYTVRWRGTRHGYTVRFRIDGHRRELATGVREKGRKAEAERRGREIFAEHVKGIGQRPKVPKSRDPLEEVVEKWIEQLPLRPVTIVTYGKYASYWTDRWRTLGELTAPTIARYCRARLRVAKGKSVGSEMSALRRFLAWCVEGELLTEAPEVPRVRKDEGARYVHRRRVAAPEYTPTEIRKLIDLLPEVSNREGWPIRARAIVAYETGLRPATLDVLRTPEHYSKKGKVLRLPDEADKEAFGREVTLTPGARKALDRVCPDVGLIFGKHRLDPYLRKAAKKALSPDKALVFTGQHFRSACLTHMLEAGAPLPGAQWLAGHRHVSTTARYVRASFRAGAEATRVWGRATRGTTVGDQKRKRRKKKA